MNVIWLGLDSVGETGICEAHSAGYAESEIPEFAAARACRN
jgi:hypothetical protein